MIGRRGLCIGVGAAWIADQLRPERRRIGGRIVGASHAVGHLLRDGPPPPSGPAERADVVVVGSGVSGASAAWRLAAAGVETTMLELEPFAGGTSAWSDDGAVPHPWGAHYLPAPEEGARATRRLLAELGVITGWDAAARPIFREEMLCHTPEERLFREGAWHGGLAPASTLSRAERDELARFRDVVEGMTAARGSDGRPVFALPCELSSRDPEWLALDRITMADWLEREGFRTPFVRWLAEYEVLDDYGGGLDDVSAWAGLFYHAARKLETEQLGGSRFLVWPEGNGWLVRRMLDRLAGERRQGALVTHVAPQRDRVEVGWLDVERREARRIEARAVVVAAPAFVTRRLVADAVALPLRTASPWVVCNLHVRRPPDPNRSWDSVIYRSPSLGYVDAAHQSTRLDDRTVLTWFRAYGGADVAATRAELLRAGWSDLAGMALADVAAAEPELVDQTERIDVMVWGHAMPRPRPGFLGERPFEQPVRVAERVAWAHVDQTGFALFEEANLHGVRAAEAVCDAIGAGRGESWT